MKEIVKNKDNYTKTCYTNNSLIHKDNKFKR